jgi:hypothetical protein
MMVPMQFSDAAFSGKYRKRSQTRYDGPAIGAMPWLGDRLLPENVLMA